LAGATTAGKQTMQLQLRMIADFNWK